MRAFLIGWGGRDLNLRPNRRCWIRPQNEPNQAIRSTKKTVVTLNKAVAGP